MGQLRAPSGNSCPISCLATHFASPKKFDKNLIEHVRLICLPLVPTFRRVKVLDIGRKLDPAIPISYEYPSRGKHVQIAVHVALELLLTRVDGSANNSASTQLLSIP